jgi:hypothetical protein
MKLAHFDVSAGLNGITEDKNIFFIGPDLQSFSRTVTSLLATGILLAPVIVLVYVRSAL